MSLVAERDALSARMAREGWWSQAFGVFQTNLREIDVTLDVEAVLDDIEGHGADTWLLNVGGILAHYPTTLPCHARNPHLAQRPGGDLIADATSAAHRRGIRLLARMDFSKVVPEIAEAHPEWAYRSARGEQQVYEGLVSVCPSGGFYQDRMFDIIDEVIDRYEVDGFFVNWFGFNERDYGRTVHGVCHCSSCRSAFMTMMGRELPSSVGDSGYQQWRRFASSTIDALTARVRARIAARRPEAALVLGPSSDIVFHEANNAVGRKLWPHATNEAVSALRIARPGRPVLVNAVSFLDMPFRMADEQPEMLGQYLLQAVARGANPSTYIMGPTRGIRYEGLGAAATITRLVTSNREVYSGLAPCSSVALVRPDGAPSTPERHAAARQEFTGWFRSLQESHVPFDVLPAEVLDVETLARFEVVVLPDIVTLTPEQDAVLENYVAGGGRLIASAASGLREVDRGAAGWLPAAELVRIEASAAELMSTYVMLEDVHPVEGARMIPRHDRAYRMAWRPDAEPRFPLLERAPHGPPEKAYGHVRDGQFAAARRSIGQGSVTQLPWTIGASYGDLGLTRIRDAAVSVVRDEQRTCLVEVDAAEQLEVILGRSSAGLVIHLVNHSGQRGESYGPAVPLHGVRLHIHGVSAAAQARSLVAPEALASLRAADVLHLEITAIADFDVLVIGNGGDGELDRPELKELL